MFGNHRFDDARPERAHFVNESQVDLAQSSREGVEKLSEWGGRLVTLRHDDTRVRSMTTAGLMPFGSGEAVVTRV